MKTKYTNKPNNVLPRAIGMDESVYNLSKRITEPYLSLIHISEPTRPY